MDWVVFIQRINQTTRKYKQFGLFMDQVHEQCKFGFRKERNRENRLKNTYSIIKELIIINIVYEPEERIWLVRWVMSGCNMVVDAIKLYHNKILG